MKNLTDSALEIYSDDFRPVASFPASGLVPSVSIVCSVVKKESGFSVFTTKFGPVVGLPSPVAGVSLIVSALVRRACPDRLDLFSPGAPFRDRSGFVIGVIGLSSNLAPVPILPPKSYQLSGSFEFSR